MSRDWDNNVHYYITTDLTWENRPIKQKLRDDIIHEKNLKKYGDKLRRIR